MTNNNQFHATPSTSHQRFQQKVNQLRGQSRTFTGLVRTLYLTLEQAIDEDVPLEALLVTIDEEHGTAGTMSGFKSALYRIRQEVQARRRLGLPIDPNVALISGHEVPAFGAQSQMAPGQHQFMQPMQQFPAQYEQPNMVPVEQPVSQWAVPQPGPMHVPYGRPSVWHGQQQGWHRPMY